MHQAPGNAPGRPGAALRRSPWSSQSGPLGARHDAARLVRLDLENAPAGTILHVGAEEGVPVRRATT
jgi:hypothetical protein